MRIRKDIISSALLIIIALSISIALFSWHSQETSALGTTTPFGGRILTMITCTCNTPPTDQLLILGPPSSGEFIYPVTSLLYSAYSPFVPNWVLGVGALETSCMIYSGNSCTPVGFGPYIYMMGTSRF